MASRDLIQLLAVALCTVLITLVKCQQVGTALGSQPNLNVLPVNTAEVVAPVAATVDDACLKCICYASTECKPIACHVAGPSQYFCGPYLISWAYWADAGKPGDDLTNPYAFEACLTNQECAERTIRQYIAKHGKDCTGDNQITCADIARIHKAGPSGCQAPNWVDNTDYWKVFLTCNLP